MDGKATVSFSMQHFQGALAITPTVNGISLIEMVSAFEREQGFDPAGGYGGLIPRWFNYGCLANYFLGNFEPNSYFAKMGGAYLLGCDCGDVGCWPLAAHIQTGGESVKWTSFRQPHRPERDYSGFGPFVFDADQYRKAVCALRDESPQWFLIASEDTNT
jgi:hypothetical protein